MNRTRRWKSTNGLFRMDIHRLQRLTFDVTGTLGFAGAQPQALLFIAAGDKKEIISEMYGQAKSELRLASAGSLVI